MAGRLDTVAERWAKLAPHVQVYGPADDRPRPAALLFHGCGGLRPHLRQYAEAAVSRGHRAFVVDSYAPRGWPRQFGMAFVCTGAVFRGNLRAGDVLASVWGVSKRPDVDASQLVVAGWSHGGWGIMELAASDRRPGDLGLADPETASLDGVKGAALFYPYVGIGATNRLKPWICKPKVFAVVSERDHLTTVRNAARVFDGVKGCGVELETWIAPGTHAFDEPMNAPPMKYDPALAAEALGRWSRFLVQTVGASLTPAEENSRQDAKTPRRTARSSP
jgi:dienelactone hydrolase